MSSMIEDVPSQFSLLRRANLHGFAALPNELLLEILSYIPPNPLTTSPASKTEIIRRQTLHSLSEVSQNLRRFFRPYLWQHIEVYSGMRAGQQELDHSTISVDRWGIRRPTKHFAKELLRQLNVVTIQDPRLAQHVRIVDIEVNATSLRPVFDELGRCFPLFPNLHAVKIITKFSQDSDKADEGTMIAVKRGFKRKILYPQIRSAILSPSIHPLLAVCPNLESLTTSEESPYLLTLIQRLTGLQKLSCPIYLTSAAAIAEYLPFLQEISVLFEQNFILRTRNYATHLIKTIRLFQNLRTVVIDLGPWVSPGMLSPGKLRLAFFALSPLDRQNLKNVTVFANTGEIIFP